MVENLNPPLCVATLCCLFGALLPAGHSIGVINTPEKVIRTWIEEGLWSRGYVLSQVSEVILWATVVSLYVAGATLGNALAPQITNKIGRKYSLLTIMILNILSCGSFLLCAYIPSVELLLIGRIVAGIATGLSTCIVSLYLSEICPIDLRGVFSALVPLGFTIGMLIAYVAGLPSYLGDATYWPLLMGIPIFYSVIGLVLLRWCPESHVFIYMRRQRKSALTGERTAILNRVQLPITKTSDSKKSATQINWTPPKASVTSTEQQEIEDVWTISRIIKNSSYKKILLFVFLLNVGQQLSGINAVFYYSMLVFRSAGLDETMSSAATLGIFIINVVMSVLALVLLKKFRRRSLLTVSLGGSCVCLLFLVAALSVLKNFAASTDTNDITNNTRYTIQNTDENSVLLDGEMYQLLHNETLNDEVIITSTIEEYTEFVSRNAGMTAMFAMLIYVVFYAIGLGPIPYCYAAESFPSGPRSVALAVGGVANWGSNAIVGLTFPVLEKFIGHYAFVLFAIFVLFLLIAVLMKLPEPSDLNSSRESVKSSDTAASAGTGSTTSGTGSITGGSVSEFKNNDSSSSINMSARL